MANNNTETKYVKWNTFIAITAVLSSTFVSVYTIHKQNNFWKYQNAIVTKQQYTQIKIKKIEELNKAFNEFTMHLSQKTDIKLKMFGFLSNMSEKSQISSVSENHIYELLDMILKNEDIITELRSNLIWHLETLSPLFSEEIVNNGKEVAEIIRNYEILRLTPEDINDITASPKSLEQIQEIIKKKNPDIQNSPPFPKFRSLIEKMYLQVKSELNIS
jgi:hypothetical protein